MPNISKTNSNKGVKQLSQDPFIVNKLSWLILLIAIFALLATTIVGLIIFQLKPSNIDLQNLLFTKFNSEKLGVVGDFFGGILNPIFGFLALLALLVNLYVQRYELNAIQKLTTESNDIQIAATELSALVSLMEYKRENEKRILEGKQTNPSLYVRMYNYKEREAEFERSDINRCAQRIEEILNKIGGLEIDTQTQRLERHANMKKFSEDYFEKKQNPKNDPS